MLKSKFFNWFQISNLKNWFRYPDRGTGNQDGFFLNKIRFSWESKFEFQDRSKFQNPPRNHEPRLENRISQRISLKLPKILIIFLKKIKYGIYHITKKHVFFIILYYVL